MCKCMFPLIIYINLARNQNMYTIRKINSAGINQVLESCLEVFMQFEAPDYAPEGVGIFDDI